MSEADADAIGTKRVGSTVKLTRAILFANDVARLRAFCSVDALVERIEAARELSPRSC